MTGGHCERYLLFWIAGSRYAVPVTSVREVHQAAAVTPAPATEAPVVGWLDLRGVPLPVLDGRAAVGIEPSVWDPAMHFIVFAEGDRLAGLMVDTVDDVVEAEPAEASGGAAQATPAATRAVVGVVRAADGLVVLLDAAGVLAGVAAPAADVSGASASAGGGESS